MKSKYLLFFGALFIAGLVASPYAHAQPGHGHAGMFRSPRLFDALQLTDGQKTTVESLVAANRESGRALFQRMQEQRQLLRDAAQAQPFDEAAVRLQAQELANLQAEMMVRRIALMQQVAGVLTADQQAKLQELQAQRRTRFNEMRERHRRQLGQEQG